MQLVILIIRDHEQVDEIITELMNRGIKGGTLIECEGALQELNRKGMTASPVFNSLRAYLNADDTEKNKLLLCAVQDEQIETIQSVVDAVTGGLSKPNTGVMMSIPLGMTYGI